jgi:Na+-driven multidrug efflux pump
VEPVVIEYARRVLLAVSASLWLRVGNMLLFVGIFRAGGDTRFGFLLDALTIWFVGVPLAYTGAFLLRLPVYWVYPLVLTEEGAKWVVAMFRFFSRRWIHNVTIALQA